MSSVGPYLLASGNREAVISFTGVDTPPLQPPPVTLSISPSTKGVALEDNPWVQIVTALVACITFVEMFSAM